VVSGRSPSMFKSHASKSDDRDQFFGFTKPPVFHGKGHDL
jgi:hypothetical protein